LTENNLQPATSLRDLLNPFVGSGIISLEEANGTVYATVDSHDIASFLTRLRDDATMRFDMLVDVVGVDALTLVPALPDRFEVVYVLASTVLGHRLCVKTHLPSSEGPELPTVSKLFAVADWLEREVYDQYGIGFRGHPNLKRLLNFKGFIGHPLRKDFPIDGRQAIPESEDLLDEMRVKLALRGRSLDSVRVAEYGNANEDDGGNDADPFIVNLGPAHPIVHGILRLLLAVEGETIIAAVPELGYLHRGAEKNMESGNYHQVIPYTDRLNYASPMMNNIGYCKAVEKMLGIVLSERDTLLRVILCELARIMDHLLCTGPHLVDLGALTPFWYLFQVREKIYDIMEKYSGARLTYSCVRIGGFPFPLYEAFAEDVEAVLKELSKSIDDVRRLVERNRIFYDRCVDVGAVSREDALRYGFTGPCLRATGYEYDLRKNRPYYLYDTFDFSVVVGTNGDTYDRFFVRVYEMIESSKIIRQALQRLNGLTAEPSASAAESAKKSKGFKKIAPPAGAVYDSTEAANGELGYYIVSDGSAKPYRIKVRSPSLCNYSAIEHMVEGAMIADLVSIIGSINVIGGEIDR
jgi:NADH-quinone oxidoreductase subunit C/D